MKRMSLEFSPAKKLDHKSAQALVSLSCKFGAQIMIEMGNKLVNAKSMMGVITLGKDPIERLALIVTGEDEENACSCVAEFIESM